MSPYLSWILRRCHGLCPSAQRAPAYAGSFSGFSAKCPHIVEVRIVEYSGPDLLMLSFSDFVLTRALGCVLFSPKARHRL